MMKEVMKNYFVFLEFYKKVENFVQKQHSEEVQYVLEQNEGFMKEIKMVKGLNLDTDGIQRQIQEYDTIICSINDLDDAKTAQIQHEWNSQIGRVPKFNLIQENNEDVGHS
jgi:hypothetical protein